MQIEILQLLPASDSLWIKQEKVGCLRDVVGKDIVNFELLLY